MNCSILLVSLFNGAWQGAVLCIVAHFALLLVRRRNAATISVVWTVLLGICLMLPVANYVFAATAYMVKMPAAEPQGRAQAASLISIRRIAPTSTGPAAQASGVIQDDAASALRLVSAHATTILWMLALIATLRLAILARDLANMIQARANVSLIDAPVKLLESIERPFRFASSTQFSSPCVLGFSPALVVIPERLLGAPRAQLLGIVLHECAHVRRFDDVQHVVARFIGAVAFFCPGVLIALRQLALYREQICDDAAISGTGDAVSYAAALAGMAEWTYTLRSPLPCLVFERNHLPQRLRVLLDSARSHSPYPNRRFACAATMVSALFAALVLRVQVPVVAEPIVQARVTGPARPGDLEIEIHIHDNNPAASPPQTFSGTWALSKCPTAGELRLQLEYRYVSVGNSDTWSESQCVPVTYLRGLKISDLSADAKHRSFAILRDAGTMQADGQISGGRGIGAWVFVPNPNFAVNLKRSGIGSPNPRQQFELGMADFRLATLSALSLNSFARPSVNDLVMMGEIGVSNDFAMAVISLPMHPKTLSKIMSLRERGVSLSYIAEIQRLGYHPSLEQFIQLADRGVTTKWIARMRARGYARLSVDDLIRLRDLGP